eukprot:764272-Hanusia_phi.AAC.1
MSVTVSKSAGIELPAGGLTTSADFDRVTIRAEAKGALVLETPFLWTGGSIQRVGTLQQSSIRFDSTACSSADVSGISRSCIRAGSTVSVKVSFTASMPFRANESFTLCMPGFRGPENVSYVTLINSTVAIRNNRGLWDPTGCDGAASLSFEYLDGIAANVQSCVAISAGAGIRLPALGVSYDTGLHLNAAVAAGELFNSRFTDVQKIGSVQMFHVDFQPGWRGSIVDVVINVQVGPCLKARDEIFITLPLTGPNASEFDCNNVSELISNCSIVSQDWENNCNVAQGGVLLRLVVSRDLPGNLSFSFTIPASSRLQLPSEPMYENSVSLQIDSNACGQTYSGRVNVSLPLGNNDFCNVKISFVPASLYRPVAVVIEFDACIQIYDGDQITIRLASFSGESFNVTLGSSIKVSWEPDSETLRILFPRLALGEHIHVVTPASLVLPNDGIPSISNGIYLNFTSDRKSLSFFNHIDLQLVGSLKNVPEIKTLLSNSKIAVSTTIVPAMDLLPQDSLTIVLPKFTEVLLMPTLLSDSFSLALWSSQNHTLTVTVASLIPAETATNLVVRFNNSFLTLPPNGLVQVSNTISLRLSSVAGLSFDYFPLTFRGLGFEQSSITFSPAIAGRPTSMSIRLVSQSLIARGQMVEIFLEAFTGSDVFDLLVTSDFTAPIYFCSWISQERTLKCLIQRDISASNPFIIRWPDYAGVALPEQGVNEHGPNMIVSVNTNTGSKVFQQGVQEFNPVGALKYAYLVRNETDFGTLWSVNLMSYMDIALNSSISIDFSGFDSSLNACFDVVSAPLNFVQDGYIKNSTISFTSLNRLSRLSELTVTILDPQLFNYLEIIRNGNYQILISVESSTGSVSDYSMELHSVSSRTIPSSQMNASLLNVSIQYEHPYAGEVTGMLIQLQTSVPIFVGDELNIELVGFEGTQLSNFTVANDLGVVLCEGSWRQYVQTPFSPPLEAENQTCWLNNSKNETYVEWQNVTLTQVQYRVVNRTSYKNVTNVLEVAIFNAEKEQCEIVYNNESVLERIVEMVNLTENVSFTVLQPVTKSFERVELSTCPRDNSTSMNKSQFKIQVLNQISLTFVNDVSPGESVLLRIPANAGIQLPTEGIAENEPSLVVRLNSSRREVNYQSDVLHSFPDVGSFRERVIELSGMSIHNDLEGLYSRQRFTWNHSSVYVSENRQSCIFSCEGYLAVSRNCMFATEINCEDTILLRCRTVSEPIIFSSDQYHETWEEKNGSTWVAMKSISLVSKPSRQTATIRFGEEARPGATSLLSISMKPKGAIVPLSQILVSLPGFTAVKGDVLIQGNQSEWFYAKWGRSCSASAMVVLIVREDRYIAQEQDIELYISETQNISLPLNGVPENAGIRITVQLVSDPQHAINVLPKFMLISRALSLSLDFDPKTPGGLTMMHLSMVLTQGLQPKDVVLLLLPGFEVGNLSLAPSLFPSEEANFEATVLQGQGVTLTSLQSFASGERIHVRYHGPVQVIIPQSGILDSQHFPSVRVQTALGHVPWTVVENTSLVGSLVNASIHLSTTERSGILEVALRFGTLMPLSPADSIVIRFPPALQLTSDNLNFSSLPNKFEDPLQNLTENTLSMKINETIQVAETILLSVRVLASAAEDRSQYSLKLSIRSINGNVDAYEFSFWNQSELLPPKPLLMEVKDSLVVIEPPMQGAEVQVRMNLTVFANENVESEILLHLPPIFEITDNAHVGTGSVIERDTSCIEGGVSLKFPVSLQPTLQHLSFLVDQSTLRLRTKIYCAAMKNFYVSIRSVQGILSCAPIHSVSDLLCSDTLDDSKLLFGNPVANETSSIELGFFLRDFILQQGDAIVLALPFYGNTQDNSMLDCEVRTDPALIAPMVKWDALSSQVEIRLGANLGPNVQVWMNLTSTCGFVLPAGGVMQSDEIQMKVFTVKWGMSPWIIVKQVQALYWQNQLCISSRHK